MSHVFGGTRLKGHLNVTLILAASMLTAVVVAGSAAAVISPNEPAGTALDYAVAATDVSLAAVSLHAAVHPAPSASASPSAAAATASAGAPTDPRILSALPLTNLTAVFDSITVRVHNGFLVRVGVRNSGPHSISAPAGQPAASLSLHFGASGYMVKSLGGCEYEPELPPVFGPPFDAGPRSPARPAYFECSSGQTLRVNKTYWQSFVFPHLDGFRYGVWLAVAGYAEDPDPGDNGRNVTVRLARPGETLPVTGTSPFTVACVALMLMIAGAGAIWYSRRRRL